MRDSIVVFDLDGTLVDSSSGILASLDKAFNDCRAHPIEPLTPKIVGPPLRETLRLLCPYSEEAILDQLVSSFKAHYDNAGFRLTSAFPGVGEMLQSLANAKIPLHIATNKRRRPTAQILKMLGWNDCFDLVISPDSCSPPLSSKAEILTNLLTEADVSAIDCLYIGDRFDDYVAAEEVGIPFALAEWGFCGDDSLLSPNVFRLQSPSADHLSSLLGDRVTW